MGSSQMEYRNLGGSGCAVSAFALGTMTFGDSTDEAGAFAQLDAFAENGGTLVDTADVYVDGASETIIGRWLADRPAEITERMVLATKGRFPTSGEPNGAGQSRRHLDRALNASLRRLGVDTVDLYQVHSWDHLTPVEETLSFLNDATRSGKIPYFGLSNYLGWQIQKTVDTAQLAGHARPVTLQTGTACCPARSNGRSFLRVSPPARHSDVLAGGRRHPHRKYQQDVTPPANTRMAGHPMGSYLRGRSQDKRTLAVLDATQYRRNRAARPGQPPRVDFPYGGAVAHQMTRRIEGGWPS
jgi:hypothetical protein